MLPYSTSNWTVAMDLKGHEMFSLARTFVNALFLNIYFLYVLIEVFHESDIPESRVRVFSGII